MKKHISLFLTSVVLIALLSGCSLKKDEISQTPTPEPETGAVENTPSQDVVQNEPAGFVPTKDLKQQALENDPNITKGFVVAGSCAYDEKSGVGEKICIDFSNPLFKGDCISLGGQWQTTACDQKGYQKKCTDFLEGIIINGVNMTGRVYQRTYTTTGSGISCIAISETL